jgi:hypothetical protein
MPHSHGEQSGIINKKDKGVKKKSLKTVRQPQERGTKWITKNRDAG